MISNYLLKSTLSFDLISYIMLDPTETPCWEIAFSQAKEQQWEKERVESLG